MLSCLHSLGLQMPMGHQWLLSEVSGNCGLDQGFLREMCSGVSSCCGPGFLCVSNLTLPHSTRKRPIVLGLILAGDLAGHRPPLQLFLAWKTRVQPQQSALDQCSQTLCQQSPARTCIPSSHRQTTYSQVQAQHPSLPRWSSSSASWASLLLGPLKVPHPPGWQGTCQKQGQDSSPPHAREQTE